MILTQPNRFIRKLDIQNNAILTLVVEIEEDDVDEIIDAVGVAEAVSRKCGEDALNVVGRRVEEEVEAVVGGRIGGVGEGICPNGDLGWIRRKVLTEKPSEGMRFS